MARGSDSATEGEGREAYQDLAGPGGVRRFAARWVVQARLVARTALHLGAGEEGELVDLALLQDPVDGSPLLTGASLGGAMREYLCQYLQGDRVLEKAAKAALFPGLLFGGLRRDPTGPQSPLVVYDARGSLPGQGVEIRDGVRIDAKTGTAAEHFKYDFELWPPGTRFDLRCDILVEDGTQPQREASMLLLLCRALEGFSRGAIRLGARGQRGLGRCEIEHAVVSRYSLSDAGGWRRWLTSWLNEPLPLPNSPASPNLTAAIKSAWPEGVGAIDAVANLWPPEPAARQFVVRIPVEFPAGLLIRSPQTTPVGADVRQLRSGGRWVLSGTSLAGAVRSRALRIGGAVKGRDRSAWVEALMGSSPEPGSGDVPRIASRLRVEEVFLSDGTDLEVTRIRLDRFTQAPIRGALVTEEPVYRARGTIEFTLELPSDPEVGDALCGFLLLLVKDLVLGDIPVGGTTGVGRGVLRPSGDLELELTGWPPRTVGLKAQPDAELRERIEQYVKRFHECPREKLSMLVTAHDA